MSGNTAPRIGILSALPSVELPALLRAFDRDPGAQPDQRYEGERYWLLHLPSRGVDFEIIVSCIAGSGNTESGLPTDRLIRRYKPQLLIFVGIACGVRAFALGDVVIGDMVWAYEYIKAIGPRNLDRSRARVVRASIRDDVQFLPPREAWLPRYEKLLAALPDALRPGRAVTPTLHRSLWIASGEKVMANGALNALNATHDLIRAGEMEGYGFALACEDRPEPVPWLIIRGISDYGDDTKDGKAPQLTLKDEYHHAAAIGAATLARLFLEVAYTPPARKAVHRPSLPALVVSEIRSFARKKRYEAIRRYRDTFSRFLWLEGRLRERVALGILAEEAAARLNDREGQVAALLDDIGWSLLAMGKRKRAEASIRRGLEVASELPDRYWLAKAHRHLAGVHLEKQQYGRAIRELNAADRAAHSIRDRHRANEMKGGIEYGRALTYLAKADYRAAARHIARSERLRGALRDPSRSVRLFALKARLAEHRGQLGKASDLYRAGLLEATNLGRRDEIIRNHLGLARLFAHHGDKATAHTHRLQAEEMLRTTPVPFEVGEPAADRVFLKRSR